MSLHACSEDGDIVHDMCKGHLPKSSNRTSFGLAHNPTIVTVASRELP